MCPRFVRRGAKGKKGAPIHAKAPGTLLPGSMMGASVEAMAIHGKYALHLPLYRQIKEFESGHRRAQRRRAVQLDASRHRCVRAAVESDAWAAAGKPGTARGRNPVRCLKASVTKGTM